MKFPEPPRAGQSIKQDFIDLMNFVRAERITSVIGGKLRESPNGKTITIDSPKLLDTRPVAGLSGPFCKLYQANNNINLLGGTVSGGTGNITVPDINLGAIASLPSDGTHFWLNIAFTAVVEDGVLLPGGDVTTATVGSGTTLPSNTVPTVAAPAGSIYVSLGEFALAKFIPSGCGNFSISHCPGSLTYYRG